MLKDCSDCSAYEFVQGDPATLNAMLASGEIDVSSSSSIEYARRWKEYLILPGVSISSTGAVGSILLFSKKPIESLAGDAVSVSSASATSAVLLKALLKYRYKIDASYAPRAPELAGMLADATAALLIGDEALRERIALNDPSIMIYDLGLLWQDFTGLPFVYALWIIREDSARRLPELAMRFGADIIKAKDAAEASYVNIAANTPESGWMGRQALVDYWKAMSYGLDDGHVAGLKMFFEMAVELGEAPEGFELRFL